MPPVAVKALVGGGEQIRTWHTSSPSRRWVINNIRCFDHGFEVYRYTGTGDSKILTKAREELIAADQHLAEARLNVSFVKSRVEDLTRELPIARDALHNATVGAVQMRVF